MHVHDVEKSDANLFPNYYQLIFPEKLVCGNFLFQGKRLEFQACKNKFDSDLFLGGTRRAEFRPQPSEDTFALTICTTDFCSVTSL